MCEVHLKKKNVSCETCGKTFEIERQYGYKVERIKGMVYEGRPWGIKEKTL